MPPAPNRTALTTREETMNGIWRSPKLKPKAATQSRQKITTSTPNIISDRCPRTEELELHRRLRCNVLSEPSFADASNKKTFSRFRSTGTHLFPPELLSHLHR